MLNFKFINQFEDDTFIGFAHKLLGTKVDRCIVEVLTASDPSVKIVKFTETNSQGEYQNISVLITDFSCMVIDYGYDINNKIKPETKHFNKTLQNHVKHLLHNTAKQTYIKYCEHYNSGEAGFFDMYENLNAEECLNA